jgi:NAD(P)-dependent dehydrogenase (short-subunit alcohol dehydrogenase family)
MTMSKPGRVAGKTALITGAAGGLGQAMAWMLAREGAKVALTDVNLSGVQALATAINAEIPGAAFAHAHDVADEQAWIDVIGAAVAEMGSLSILVNNTGIGGDRHTGELAPRPGDQHRKRHAWLQTRHEAPARGCPGLDHQHLLGRRSGRRARHGGL